MKTTIFIFFIIFAAYTREYPQYNQCDAKWANQKLGTSNSTICQVGCLVSAVASALTGTGHNQNPSSLNTWLKNNKGYANKDDFVWGSINSFGVTFEGKVPNSLIKINLDVGYVVIINVKKGAHWVLATGYDGTKIMVKDSLYLNVTSYDISEVVAGNTGIYKVPNALYLPVFITDLLSYIKSINQKQNSLSIQIV